MLLPELISLQSRERGGIRFKWEPWELKSHVEMHRARHQGNTEPPACSQITELGHRAGTTELHLITRRGDKETWKKTAADGRRRRRGRAEMQLTVFQVV